MSIVNILHLSDLHFGYESSASITPMVMREITLKSLLKTLKEIQPENQPHFVVVSGDIGWKGAKSDYELAENWLKELLDIFKLSADELILCPGNHDMDLKKARNFKTPTNPVEADDLLQLENIEDMETPFQEYVNFCNRLRIPKLSINNFSSHLIGERKTEHCRFVILNSAWFSRGLGDNEMGKLWLGLPQLFALSSASQITDPDLYDEESLITIAVLHHTSSWLTPSEQYIYGDRPSTYKYLAERAHLIFSGHNHSRLELSSRISDSYARLFIGGTAYSGSNYRNNFSIIKIDTDIRTATRMSYEFDPAYNKWELKLTECDLCLNKSKKKYITEGRKVAEKEKILDYYKAFENYILEYRKRKMGIVNKSSCNMNPIRRKVLVYSDHYFFMKKHAEDRYFDSKYYESFVSLNLLKSKPCFLFGELGSGKSIMVSTFAIEICNKLLTILIPARYFFKKDIDTAAKLIAGISDYVNEDIIFEGDFNLSILLRNKQEVVIIIDGLDELDISTANQLLLSSEKMAHLYPTILLLASGRPFELMKLNFINWQCLEIPPLTKKEQEEILYYEAISEGLLDNKAREDAVNKIQILYTLPDLASIAITPLFVRLLRQHLSHQINSTRSLGDLLHNLIRERLGDWSIKDGKEVAYKNFKQVFPDSYSREKILGKVAAAFYKLQKDYISPECLYEVIESEVGMVSDRNLVIAEGCDYFKKNFLDCEDDYFFFSSKPILQYSLGFFILDNHEADISLLLGIDIIALWREYSFAASIARRKNILDKVRNQLKSLLKILLDEDDSLPAAAIVVSESCDTQLALDLLKEMNIMEFRPCLWFPKLENFCSYAIAHCIYLTGEKGFNWFYNQYIDPRYPKHYSALVDLSWLIVKYLIILNNFKMSKNQIALLSDVAEHTITAKSYFTEEILGTIVFIVPERFHQRELAILYATQLDSIMNFTSRTCVLSDVARTLLKKQYYNENKKYILAALEKCTHWSEYNLYFEAGELWLELCGDIPPASIINSIVYQVVEDDNYYTLYKEIINRTGEDNIVSLLYWYVFDDSHLSTAAVKILCKYHNLQSIHILLGGYADKLHYLSDLIDEHIMEIMQIDYDHLIRVYKDNMSMFSLDTIITLLSNCKNNYNDIFYDTFIRFSESHNIGDVTLSKKNTALHGLLLKNNEYVQVLKQGLNSNNDNYKFSAACVLYPILPELGDVLIDIIIRSTNIDNMHFLSHSHFLESSIRDDSIYYLAKNIDTYSSSAKVLALLFLYYNQHNILEDQFFFLVENLLENMFSYYDACQYDDQVNPDNTIVNVFLTDEVFTVLLAYLNKNIDLKVVRAGNILIKYHYHKMSIEQIARCWCLFDYSLDIWHNPGDPSFSSSLWFFNKYEKNIALLYSNPEFVSEFEAFSCIMQKKGYQVPFVKLYLKSLDDKNSWKDIVCRLTVETECTSSGSDVLFWLIKCGQEDNFTGSCIGETARELLHNKDIFNDEMNLYLPQYLLILADEFNKLLQEDIEITLSIYGKHKFHILLDESIVSRIGKYMPGGFVIPEAKHSHIDVFYEDFEQTPSIVNSLDEVVNILCNIYKSDEEGYDKFVKFNNVIINTLIAGSLSDEDLLQISTTNELGLSFSLIIELCRNRFRISPSVVDKFNKIKDLQNNGRYQFNNWIHRLLNCLEHVLHEESKN